MLADYLARYARGNPRRYAIQHQAVPGGMDAIRNYIRLALQAHTIPAYHAQGHDPNYFVTPNRPPPLAVEGDLGRQLAGSLMQTGDPGDLMAYLDHLDALGVPAVHDPAVGARAQVGGGPDARMHGLLRHIFNTISGPDQLAVMHGFQTPLLADASQHAPVRELFSEAHTPRPYIDQVNPSQEATYHGRVFPFYRALDVSNHPLAGSVLGHMRNLSHQGTPIHARVLTSIADRVFRQAQGGGRRDLYTPALNAHENMQTFLEQGVIPHLLGLGRQRAQVAQGGS